jgi:hypothetical protein
MRYGFDTSDPLNDWLDEGLHMVEDAHDWPFLQSIASVSVGSGVNTLTFPSDFFKIYTVRNVTDSRKLKVMDVTEFEREVDDPTVQGSPMYYIIVDTDTIQMWPVTDTSMTFRVVYQRALTLVSNLAGDGTALDGPATIHYPIVLCAAYTALMAENEEDRAQAALGQFESRVARLWGKFGSTDRDEPRQVVDVMGYGDS